MTYSDFRRWLEQLAEVEASVPARVILERLPDSTPTPTGDSLADLTVEEAGDVLGRSPSTVRDYCRRDLLPGAYRQQGREWKIPRAAIRAFQRSEAGEVKPVTTRRRRGEVDLGSWRRELK